MKLSQRQIEHTSSQIGARAVPDDHPLVPELSRMYGEHTFFLDADGLGIIEEIEIDTDASTATVVRLADWADDKHTKLEAHAPEPTDLTVDLGPAKPDYDA
jgi:hypothetical protein